VTDAGPALLEVVPWNHGYAHSWALAWLLEHDAARDAVLGVLLPDGAAPWTLEGPVRREHFVPGARADLAFDAMDSSGRTMAVAVETKVADPIKPAQLERYCDEGFEVVLLVPGLTGLLFAPNAPIVCEWWITGAQIASAVEDIELPPIIRTYLDAVETEAARMDDALAMARGERDDFDRDGRADYDALADAAWIVEVVAALRANGADEPIIVRSEANDRGLFWKGAGRRLPGGNGAGLYIDVIADLRTHRCAVAVKVADGDQEGRWACLDAAVRAGPPSTGAWKPARRRTGKTQTVWKLDVSECAAPETARHALAAKAFIASLAGDADV
jgi:hypothetical protein